MFTFLFNAIGFIVITIVALLLIGLLVAAVKIGTTYDNIPDIWDTGSNIVLFIVLTLPAMGVYGLKKAVLYAKALPIDTQKVKSLFKKK